MVKVTVKLSLCLTKHHAMKTYMGSGGIAPPIPVTKVYHRPIHNNIFLEIYQSCSTKS